MREGGNSIMKFKLKNGITGKAELKGTMYEVEFSNGVMTRVDSKLADKYLSNGTWKKTK